MLGVATRCCVCVTFCCSGECGWLCETSCVYIRSHSKMAALGYVYTLGKQTFVTNFHASSCMTGISRRSVLSARSVQKFGGKNRSKKKSDLQHFSLTRTPGFL